MPRREARSRSFASASRTCPMSSILSSSPALSYLDKRETVDHYLAVMERLCVEALPTPDSLEMLEEMLT